MEMHLIWGILVGGFSPTPMRSVCHCWRAGLGVSVLHILILIGFRTVWSRSECQIVMSIEDYGASCSCSGDPVQFLWPDEINRLTDTDSGSAEITLSYRVPSISLINGTDVTFTSIIITDVELNYQVAFTILNSTNCVLQNVFIDNLTFRPDSGGVPLLITGSKNITIENAVFSNLGWHEEFPGGTPGVVVIDASDVILRNTTIRNVKMLAGMTPTPAVKVVASTVVAEDSLWEDVVFETYKGTVLEIQDGSTVELRHCTVTNNKVTYNSAWELEPSVPLTIDGGSKATLIDSVLPRIKVTGDSTARVRNVTFDDIWPIERPILQVVDSSAVVSDTMFNSISAIHDYRGIVLDVVRSKVNVTNCEFDRISWGALGNTNFSQESQVVLVRDSSTLTITDTTFSAIGGCGTPVRATDASRLDMSRVSITGIDISAAIGERRAAIVITSGSFFNAQDSVWRNINVGNSTSGAAIAAGSATDIVIGGCNFTDIASPESAAVQLWGTTDLVRVVDCIWSSINASSALHLFNLASGSQVAVNNSEFTNCKAINDGGALRLETCESNVMAILSNLTFTNNTGSLGGALMVSSCSASMSKISFLNNMASDSGGAVYLQSESHLSISSSEFVTNTAAASGGALLARARSSLTCSSCTFTSNTARNGPGGAVAMVEGTSASITESSFINNMASDSGGAIDIYASNLTLNESTFLLNTAKSYGGAVAANDSHLTVASGSTFTRNFAPSGGAILGNQSQLILTDSNFFSNAADRFGGAVFTKDGSLILQGTVLTANTAKVGGALCVDSNSAGSSSSVARLILDSGNAAADKAQLLRTLDSVFDVSNCTRIINSTFAHNSCNFTNDENAGGAIYVKSHVLVQSSSFISNTCPNGGAATFGLRQRNQQVAVAQCSFRYNQGLTRGGAVQLYERDIKLYGLFFENSFKGNSASGYGGAIDAPMGSALDIMDNDFTDNGNSQTSLAGGAVYLSSCSNLDTDVSGAPNIFLLRNNFSENSASGGAAVYSDSCNVTSKGDRFIGNNATDSGGAMQAVNVKQSRLSFLQMWNVWAEENYAKSTGGAVAVQGHSLTVRDSVFKGNNVRVAGGAFMIFDSSPSALLVRESNSTPYYSSAEYDFLKATVTNCNFTGNTALSGGGGIYSDTSRLIVKNSTFNLNTAGDDFPNDDWSDSGGAIFAAQCFGLSEAQRSTFTSNRATGGPGGAILNVACNFALTDCSFDCNECSTFGGAIAAGNQRQPSSKAYAIPTLVMLSCNFTNNRALLYDGGAVLSKDMNATAFLSRFTANKAGRNGGALALLNNIGSALRRCNLEDNSAVQYGGGAYALTNSVLTIEDSTFQRNYALLYGGALSIVRSTCVLAARTIFEGNHANTGGGALQVQLSSASTIGNTTSDVRADDVMDVSDGDSGTCAAVKATDSNQPLANESGPCITQFLSQVKSLASPCALELLGLSDIAVLSYNATLAYEADNPYVPYLAMFRQGGAPLLPVPRMKGPAPIFGFDLDIVPGSGSVIQLAPGSALTVANWAQLRMQVGGDTDGVRNTTQLYFLNRTQGVQVEGAVVQLAAGSAMTALKRNMEILPAGGSMIVLGEQWFVGADLTTFTPYGNLSALSIVLSYRGAANLPNGRIIPFNEWNRFVLRATAGRSFLMDAMTGTTYDMAVGMTTIQLSSCSSLQNHFVESVVLEPADGSTHALVTVLANTGGWRLDNGTTLSTGGTRPVISAVPADRSSVRLAAGSSVVVDSWLPYNVRFRPDGAVQLEHLGRGVRITLGSYISLRLVTGSVILTPPEDITILPRGTSLTGQGGAWVLGDSRTSGSFAMSLVMPAGSALSTAPTDSSLVVVQDWNRYVLWAGPTGTILYDTDAIVSQQSLNNSNGAFGVDVATMLTEAATVQLSRDTPFVLHDASSILSSSLDLTLQNTSWVFMNGTNVSVTSSTVAVSAVFSKGCLLTLPNGTAVIESVDWYRYLLLVVRSGSYLFDTAIGAVVTGPLPVGTRAILARGSALIVHDSFASVQMSTFVIDGSRAVLDALNLRRTMVVLPADGSSLTFDNSSDTSGSGTLVSLEDRGTAGRFIPWVGVNGSCMYDTELLVTFRFAPGSTLNLTANSHILVHDSGTTVFDVNTNLTVSPGGTWSLSNGTTLSLDDGTIGLSVSPASTSHILYGNTTWNITVSEPPNFVLHAGMNGTTLYDALIDASFLLNDGSMLHLSNTTLSYFRNGTEAPLGATANLTIRAHGRKWLLSNGTELDPGNGTSNSTESEIRLHVNVLQPFPGEVGRLCSVDLNEATYMPDPYSFDFANARSFLGSKPPANFTDPNLYSEFARAAYRYNPDIDTSGFNASLLIPFYSIPWDSLGRPTSAVVQCTVAGVPEDDSRALNVSLMQFGLIFANNTAGGMGGGMFLDGGQGSVLMDNLQVENNTVSDGDGGGMAIYQSDAQRDMSLQVYLVSSHFSGNKAMTGLGGAISLAAGLVHQQAVLLNTTLEGNLAAAGGGLALSKRISLLLNESTIANNQADMSAVAGGRLAGSESLNYGTGGGILASSCNELQLTSGTRLYSNKASGRGGGLATYACALVTLYDTEVKSNEAQSGGGVYMWNNLPAMGTSRDTDVGGSITIVIGGSIWNNTAVDRNTTGDVLEGIGGGILLRGHVSTLLADSNFTNNTATSQGGSIFIESVCDLTDRSTFLIRKMEMPTAFNSSQVLLNGIVDGLQESRPKGCWGTVVYKPSFFNNEAKRSGGALFSSHPEALSLVCDVNASTPFTGSRMVVPPSFDAFDESLLAEQVLLAMKKASYQVLDNRIVQSCYKEEIERILKRSSEETKLTGVELSTLDISNNRASGYGYLIAIIPSKLQVVNVTWTGNVSNVASDMIQQQQRQDSATVQARRQLSSTASGNTTGNLSRMYYSLADNPFFSITPGLVYDPDTQGNRLVLNYHVTAYSNKPMDLPILLLDALDQIASENTTLRQAQIRANWTGATNRCKAELLGGYEGTARNGTVLMTGMRLRALKGENYSIEFRVEDAAMQGTVEPLVVNITIPPCSIGEVPRDDGYLCQKCDQRSFSLWEDTDDLVNCTYTNLSTITCYPCPYGAECLGGAVIVPRQGFWHSAANSTFMNSCPNPQACREGNDEAQEMLAACQEWWYSRPQGFDYLGLIDSVVYGNTTTWLNSIRTTSSPRSTAVATAASAIDLADPSLCVLWGLPYNHPKSYMQKQCAEGYQGHLCAVCAPVNGTVRAANGDFECQACFSSGTSITIAILGFVANVVMVMVTILLSFMTDYTEDEDMGIGDLLKVLIVHMQFFVIVTRINIDWPPSIRFVTSLLSAFTGAMSKVYTPSCLLDVNSTPEDAAQVNQLVAIISPLLTTICVAALWMVIRVILFNLKNATRTEQKLDMRTIDEYRMDRARRLHRKKRQDDGGTGVAAGATGDSAYSYDAFTDLRASELLPDAGGDIAPHETDDQRNEQQLDVLELPEAAQVRESYGTIPGELSTIHLGLPIQEAGVEEQDELILDGLKEKDNGEKVQEAHASALGKHHHQQPISPHVATTDCKPVVGSKEAAQLGEVDPMSTADHDGDEGYDVLSKDRESVYDDFSYPGLSVGHPSKSLLPMPPQPNVLKTVNATVKEGLREAVVVAAVAPPPLPPPPKAPLPPPAAPTPLTPSGREISNKDIGSAEEGVRTALHHVDGGQKKSLSDRGLNAVTDASSNPGHTNSTQWLSELGMGGAAAAGSAPRSVMNIMQQKVSGSSHPAFTIVASSEDALPQDPGSLYSTAPGHVGQAVNPRGCGDSASLTRGPESKPSPPNVAELIPSADIGGASDGGGGGGGGGGGPCVRSIYANLTVRPVVPDLSRDFSSGRTAAKELRGGISPEPIVSYRGGAGGEGHPGKGDDSPREERRTGGSGRLTSRYLRGKLTQGSSWLRTFFTYDEEAAPEDGQVRWASLANIHRTMAWWRQELLVVMIACFVLYPAWAQATLQIFACYYLDDGTGYYPQFQLAQWGKGYWILNMNQECYLGHHARVWVPIGVVCILVICAGIPFLTFMVTWTHRTALRTVHVVQTYGFLYRRYDFEQFYWWEAAMQVQTLLLVMVDVFGRVLAVYQQAVLLMSVLMLIMWANMFFQPLKHKVLERMSSLSLAVLSFTVALGLFFVPPMDRKDPVTAGVASFIGAIIVALNTGLLLYFVYVMWNHGRDAINRNVAVARQRMIMAGAKVQMGFTAVRHHVTSASQNLRTATYNSLSVMWKSLKRSPGANTPPLTPRPGAGAGADAI